MKDNYFIEFDYSETSEYWCPQIENIDSQKEAINKAFEIIQDDLNNNRLQEVCNFRVGRQVRANIPFIWADSIIEDAQNNALDEYSDLSDDYLEDVTKEQQDELEKKLNEVWENWHNKYNLNPTWFNIEDSQEFTVDEVEKMLSEK